MFARSAIVARVRHGSGAAAPGSGFLRDLRRRVTSSWTYVVFVSLLVPYGRRWFVPLWQLMHNPSG
jgi:hypothetical protein